MQAEEPSCGLLVQGVADEEAGGTLWARPRLHPGLFARWQLVRPCLDDWVTVMAKGNVVVNSYRTT